MTPNPDKSRLRELASALRAHLRGQDHAIEPVAGALRRSVLGFDRFMRLLLLGPTGTGKTELALAIARVLLGSTAHLHRFDCSEFQSLDSLKNLLGDRAGDAGRFADFKAVPGALILFDELEKGCPEFIRLLLQILEPGHITNAQGETIDLSRFYIIATSNIASEAILELQHSTATTLDRHVLQQAQRVLRPEVFNRFDLALVFRPLDYASQVEICHLKVEAYLAPLRAKGWQLTLAPEVVPFLLRQGFDRRLGARPLLRAIRRFIGDALVTAELADQPKQGTLVVDGEQLVFRPSPEVQP